MAVRPAADGAAGEDEEARLRERGPAPGVPTPAQGQQGAKGLVLAGTFHRIPCNHDQWDVGRNPMESPAL